MRLAGKTVLVTAAGQGMGRAAAIAMADEGATVLASDLNPDLMTDLPDGIVTAALDVTDRAAVEAYVAAAPQLDGLFNCAGMVHHGTLLDVTEEDWARSMDLNVTSMVRLCRLALPNLIARAAETGSTSILNMSSMCSSIKGFPNRAAYGATKAAVIGLTKSIAADFVGQGIRCNALCPGTIDTPSLQGRINAAPDPAAAEKDFIARQPMGRLGTVEDITPMIVYLMSDDSRFVTGQAMLVDGGVTI